MGPRIDHVRLVSATKLEVSGEIKWDEAPPWDPGDEYATFGAVVSSSDSDGEPNILACGWSSRRYGRSEGWWSADLDIVSGVTLTVGEPVDAYGLAQIWAEHGTVRGTHGWPNDGKPIEPPRTAS
jgi:hypothetical protein